MNYDPFYDVIRAAEKRVGVYDDDDDHEVYVDEDKAYEEWAGK